MIGTVKAMSKADTLYAAAQEVLPGGVCASARANAAIGHPFFVSRGEGALLYDLDGRDYVDMCTSHGASLLGHGHPGVVAAARAALERGVLCACETEDGSRLAKLVCERVPCAEMVRFGGSGTETVMHALRLARTVTGRRRFIKFEGHFHGYADAFNYSVMPPLDQAGPAHTPRAYPESAGMPEHNADDLVVVPFNDPEALRAAFAAHGHDIAALLMEPVNYDQGCIEPLPGFARLCRELCDAHGVLLFFDEVLTAFRVGPGGAQAWLGVTPDLCVLGKAFGGSMPISALAGRRAVMRHLKPLGQSQMSGTYLGHPVAVAGAIAALEAYGAPGFYERLDAVCRHFYAGFEQCIARSGVPVRLQYLGPRFGLYFGVREPVTNYRQAARRDLDAELRFIRACWQRGVYFQPSAHHGFSSAHTKAHMDRVLVAIEGALAELKASQPATT